MCTHNENLLSYRIASFLIKRSRSVTSTISLKMSGHSTPKRLLEDDVQDSQNDDYAFPPKRNKLVADQTEHGIFRSSSNSPCIIPSSTPIINAAIQTTRVHLANGGSSLPLLPQIQKHTPSQVSSHTLNHMNSSIYKGAQKEQDELNQICFGMLTEVQIRISRMYTRQSISFDEVSGDNGIFVRLNLVITEDRCDILARGVSIATMNERTHLVLNSLPSNKVLKCSGLISKTKLDQKLAIATVTPSPGSPKLTCTMDILVFGPRTVGDALARHFSRYRLFLQHPYPMTANVNYENPQYLAIVGSSFSNGTILPPISADVFQGDSDCSNTPEEDESVDIYSVLDNLPMHDYLREADIGKGIESTLLRWRLSTLWRVEKSWKIQSQEVCGTLIALLRVPYCISTSSQVQSPQSQMIFWGVFSPMAWAWVKR